MEVVAPGTRQGSGRTAAGSFYVYMSIAILLSVVLGFSRSFYLHALFPDREVPREALFLVHGMFFSAWFVLLVVQTVLVSSRRVRLHRKVGVAAMGLAAAMVVLGVYGALLAASRPTGFIGVTAPSLNFLAVPFFDMVLFTVFFSLAIAWRGNPQAHKRLMLLASINMLTAAIGRWPMLETAGQWAFFGATDLFLLPIVFWDLRSRGSLHPVTIWGGASLVLSQPLRWILSKTAAWHAFAVWAVGWVR